MSKSLTDKQRRFVKNKAKGMNGTQAAIKAGVPATSAAVYATNTLKRANIQEVLTKAMEKAGLDTKKIGELIHKGATKATGLYGPKSVEHADWGARAKYTDMALKVMGGYAPAKIDANVKLGIIDLVEAAKMKREGDDGSDV